MLVEEAGDFAAIALFTVMACATSLRLVPAERQGQTALPAAA